MKKGMILIALAVLSAVTLAACGPKGVESDNNALSTYGNAISTSGNAVSAGDAVSTGDAG